MAHGPGPVPPRSRAPVAQTALEVGRRAALLEAVARDVMLSIDADPEESLARLARLVVPALAEWSLVTLVEDDGTFRDLGAAHSDPSRQSAVDRYARLRLAALQPDSYLLVAAREGVRQLLQEGAADSASAMLAAGEARDLIEALAPRSMLIEPLVARGRTIALITLFDGEEWNAARLETAAEVATRAALAVDNSRAYVRAQASQAEALRYARRMRLLGDVSDLLSSTLDQRLAVTQLASLVVPELADWCIVTVNAGSGRARDLGWAHRDPACDDALGVYARKQFDAMNPAAAVAVCLRTGEPVIVPEMPPALLDTWISEAGARADLGRLAPGSVAVFPLKAGDLVMGAIALVTLASRGPLNSQELDTAAEVARRAGLALDNARLYGQQRQLAETLQRSLLTEPPTPERFQIAVRYMPAAAEAQVGGDWYDAFEQPDGALVCAIGDVIGHDSRAAAAMGQLRGLLRGIGYTTGARPASLLRRLDEAMEGLQVDTSATAVVAQLESRPDTGATLLRWSNAGHPPPMLIDVAGEVRALEAESVDLLLGFDCATHRSESSCELLPGSTLLLYTDGLVERRGVSLDDGLAGLLATLTRLGGEPLESLCDELLKELLPGVAEDDIAIVAVRFTA